MIAFLAANWGNLVVAFIVLLIIILAVRKIVKDKKQGRTSCGCGCANCPSAGICHKKETMGSK